MPDVGEGAEHESGESVSGWRRTLAVIGPGALAFFAYVAWRELS